MTDTKLFLFHSNTTNCVLKDQLRLVEKYYQQNVFMNHKFRIYLWKGFGIKLSTMGDMQ